MTEMIHLKKNLQIIIILVILGIFLFGCAPHKSGVVGNPKVINEIARIEALSVVDAEGQQNNLTVADLDKLKELVKGDDISQSLVDELQWLIANNESTHILHTTGFIRDYFTTGKDIPCVPHEMWHISLYIKHGYMNYAKTQIEELGKIYPEWEGSVDQKSKAFPQFYHGLDDLKSKIKQILPQLKKGNYTQDILDQLDLIGEAGVC